MVTDAENRLGRNGAEEIKCHPFFDGFDWKNVRNMKAPYLPKVASEISNENFDEFKEEEPYDTHNKKGGSRKLDMKFVGYTYKADVEEQRSMLNQVLKDLGEKQEEVDPNLQKQSVRP
jgi:serine/threonine kinase 38